MSRDRQPDQEEGHGRGALHGRRPALVGEGLLTRARGTGNKWEWPLVGVALAVGAIPYALREEPVWLLSTLGARLVADGAEGFARAWAGWAARTASAREALGPWLMGHLSDAALGVATAAFVSVAQRASAPRVRLAWHVGAAGLLLGLEGAQAPLGFGTFDPVDLAALFVGYGVTAALAERAARVTGVTPAPGA